MLADCKLEHILKADSPMLVTPGGMIMAVKPVHHVNTSSPILVKLLGRVDLYVIHTAAPVSVENFEMRNNQLSQL